MSSFEPGGPHDPWWLRATGVVDRLYRAVGALRDELALAVIPPERWRAIVAERYGRHAASLRDTVYHDLGLFEWERYAIDAHFPPPPSRILIGGAGAGREMLALARRGHAVAGFDPAEPLVSALAANLLDAGVEAPVARIDYETLAAAVGSPQGVVDGAPARCILDAAPYDAVILGFGSVTYVADPRVREALLPALACLAPSGPVLLSFETPEVPTGEIARGALLARRLLARLPGARRVADGDRLGGYGFEHAFTEDEIATLARAAGYCVAHQAREPYPHAVLVPSTASTAVASGRKGRS